MLQIFLRLALLSIYSQNQWLKIDSYFIHQIKLVMIPKRNNFLDITKANQILLLNSNHCKRLLKKLIAAQARTSIQEVSTPLNFQKMRIVARSQQKISQVLLRKTFNNKIRRTHMQRMLSKYPNKKMLFSILNNRILNCFSSLITICFHKTTISFLINLLCNFHHFLVSVTLRNKQTNNLCLNFAHNQHFCLTICKIIKVKLPLCVQHLQCPSVQMYQISLTHRQKATQNKILSPKP